MAKIAKWAIIVFAVMAALVQLRVATELIQILFMGIVFMFALAGGIAFGFGGKGVTGLGGMLQRRLFGYAVGNLKDGL